MTRFEFLKQQPKRASAEDRVKAARIAYEAKYGKDNPAVQLLRNSRMGQGQTAHDLYVTGSIKRPKNEVETPAEE